MPPYDEILCDGVISQFSFARQIELRQSEAQTFTRILKQSRTLEGQLMGKFSSHHMYLALKATRRNCQIVCTEKSGHATLA